MTSSLYAFSLGSLSRRLLLRIYAITWTLNIHVADSPQLSTFVDDPNAMYVFDRGYIDYRKFDEFYMNKIRFTSRLKRNASYQLLSTNEGDKEEPDPSIVRDVWVRLGIMKHEDRLITATDGQGNHTTIVTNDLFTSASELADLYRKHWQIELFFKRMKQHMKLTFFGTSQHAVENQIYIALIIYILLLGFDSSRYTKSRNPLPCLGSRDCG